VGEGNYSNCLRHFSLVTSNLNFTLFKNTISELWEKETIPIVSAMFPLSHSNLNFTLFKNTVSELWEKKKQIIQIVSAIFSLSDSSLTWTGAYCMLSFPLGDQFFDKLIEVK
jgi:predicted transcriptional regulator